jgi:hypothetical protein
MGVLPLVALGLRVLDVGRHPRAVDSPAGRDREHEPAPQQIALGRWASTLNSSPLGVSGHLLMTAVAHPAPIEGHSQKVWTRPRHFTDDIEGEALAGSHDEHVGRGADYRRSFSWVAKGCRDLSLDVRRQLGYG